MNCPKHHKKMTFIKRTNDTRYFKCPHGCMMIARDNKKRLLLSSVMVDYDPEVGVIE
jgi:hypothetical protein